MLCLVVLLLQKNPCLHSWLLYLPSLGHSFTNVVDPTIGVAHDWCIPNPHNVMGDINAKHKTAEQYRDPQLNITVMIASDLHAF